jgi:putative transposase
MLESIRQATNRVWVPGNDRFKAEISNLQERQVPQTARGGDRKSAAYRKQHEINRV